MIEHMFSYCQVKNVAMVKISPKKLQIRLTINDPGNELDQSESFTDHKAIQLAANGETKLFCIRTRQPEKSDK
jgi:hypothetical protein